MINFPYLLKIARQDFENLHIRSVGKVYPYAISISYFFLCIFRNRWMLCILGMVATQSKYTDPRSRYYVLVLFAYLLTFIESDYGALSRYSRLGIGYQAYQTLWRLTGIDHMHVHGLQGKFAQEDEEVINSAKDCLGIRLSFTICTWRSTMFFEKCPTSSGWDANRFKGWTDGAARYIYTGTRIIKLGLSQIITLDSV